MLGDGQKALVLLMPFLVTLNHSWATDVLGGIAEAQRNHLQGARDLLRIALGRHREITVLRRLPVVEWRLWKDTLDDPEVREELVTFFDPEHDVGVSEVQTGGEE